MEQRCYRHTLRSIILCCAAATAAVLLVYSCWPKNPDPSQTLIEKDRKLFDTYLHGNIATARQCLRQEIELFEAANTSSNPGVRLSSALFMQAARLYTLEKKVGDESAADLALIRARYWNLRRFELDGPMTKAKLDGYHTITPERMVILAEKLDKGMNQGHLAEYNVEIETTENKK